MEDGLSLKDDHKLDVPEYSRGFKVKTSEETIKKQDSESCRGNI